MESQWKLTELQHYILSWQQWDFPFRFNFATLSEDPEGHLVWRATDFIFTSVYSQLVDRTKHIQHRRVRESIHSGHILGNVSSYIVTPVLGHNTGTDAFYASLNEQFSLKDKTGLQRQCSALNCCFTLTGRWLIPLSSGSQRAVCIRITWQTCYCTQSQAPPWPWGWSPSICLSSVFPSVACLGITLCKTLTRVIAFSINCTSRGPDAQALPSYIRFTGNETQAWLFSDAPGDSNSQPKVQIRRPN